MADPTASMDVKYPFTEAAAVPAVPAAPAAAARPPIKRKHSQNLQHHLWDRESGLSRQNFRGSVSPYREYYERPFHKSITPNLTIQNVDKPLGYMRKFTPNGRLLISFSHDQRSLEIYEYHGVARIADMLHEFRTEVIASTDDSEEACDLRRTVYSRLFTLRRTILLMSEIFSFTRSYLNREFSIFVDDGRYVLLGAITKPHLEIFIPIEYYHQYPDLNDDCDICDFTLFVVDLQQDTVTDIFPFRRDSILLAHNHGVSVYGYTVAVLSKCRQCIEILELVQGKLVRLYVIGRYEDDTEQGNLPGNEDIAMSSLTCSSLSQLKQRILSYMYRRILTIESERLRRVKIRDFYKFFIIYESMTMTKMQLIDSDHLLIRYEQSQKESTGDGGNININININTEEKNKFKLYVFYCISTQLVLKVYHRHSVELLYMLRNYCDKFRNVRSLQSQRPSSSPSNNTHFRAAFNNTIVSIPGGQTEAALRLNPTLPISCQSFATSPYLDFNLFNYNDRVISAFERPKISSMDPICFKDRNTNITKFRFFLEQSNMTENLCGNCRELVAFLFHPFEPFVISIQKLTSRNVVNFHIYNETTVVDDPQ